MSLTKPQIEDQKRRFERLLKTKDFLRLVGHRLICKTNKRDWYNALYIILLNQKIQPTMHHPDTVNNRSESYLTILERRALEAYAKSLKPEPA